MTILGKLLIFFNLLAAGGFAYLATQNWKGRQTIAAAGVRHVIIVQGLPLGGEKGVGQDGKPKPELDDPTDMPTDPEAEIPFRIRLAGGYLTTTISKPLLDGFFKAVPGVSTDPNRDAELGSLGSPQGTVPNQLAEVKRVKARIEELLAAAERPELKVKLLSNWLVNQPETFEERVAVQAMATAGDADGLKKALDARFAAVLDAPKALEGDALAAVSLTSDEQKAHELGAPLLPAERATGLPQKVDESRLAPIDDTERRVRIAHLLVHLDQDSDWQKRVSVVVGLRRYAPAIVAQSRRFLVMSERVRLATSADQAAYVPDPTDPTKPPILVSGFLFEERNLLRLAIDRTDLANRQADLEAKWGEQNKRDANFVGVRNRQLAEITARLNKVGTEVNEMLARQSGIEAALFEVQREVAVTLDEVYRLEADLVVRERELLKSASKN